MAIPFTDNFKINAGAPVDAKYLNSLNQPYTSVSAVTTAIVEAQRYIGLTVNINNVEYWFKNGVGNGDLEIKTAGGGSGTITGGTNGLGVNGANICLGGTLLNDTVIDGGGGDYTLQYAGNYALNYNNRSLVDKEYVDSLLSGTELHIPVFTALGSNITDSSLTFNDYLLYNPNDLTIEVEDTKNIFLVSPNSGLSENIITLGRPSLSSGITYSNICVAGTAVNIDLTLASKGSGSVCLKSCSVWLGDSVNGNLNYNSISHSLILPQNSKICSCGGNFSAPDACPMCVIGGYGYGGGGTGGTGGNVLICGGIAQGSFSKVGGDVVLKGGAGAGGASAGRIKLCALPLQTSETAVVYVDVSGNLSCGPVGGGAGTYGLDSPATEQVGGIVPNTPTAILTGKTAFCILKDMLVVEKYGALSDPYTTASLSPLTSIFEIGSSATFDVVGTLNRGSINPAYWTDGVYSTSPTYRVGAAQCYSFTGAQMPSGFFAPNSQPVTSYTVLAGTQTWSVCTCYGAGPQPKSNKNNAFGTQCLASTTDPASTNITGILPWYWGTSTSPVPSATCIVNCGRTGGKCVKVVTTAQNSMPITYNSLPSDYLWFAIPACYGAVAAKTCWFVSTINSGQIGVFLFNNPITCVLNSASGYWAGEAYCVYISMYSTGTDPGIPMCMY
jgi:hypothetical protein